MTRAAGPPQRRSLAMYMNTFVVTELPPGTSAQKVLEEIEELTKHLKTHRKDVSSRRGLIKMVSERRSLLQYLEREDAKAYADIIAELELKK